MTDDRIETVAWLVFAYNNQDVTDAERVMEWVRYGLRRPAGAYSGYHCLAAEIVTALDGAPVRDAPRLRLTIWRHLIGRTEA